MNRVDMTDEKLIAEFLEGNKKGFEELMKCYQPQAYCLARAKYVLFLEYFSRRMKKTLGMDKVIRKRPKEK
jgi:hypothetical protein